jgi:hypothetical protein
MVVKIRFGSGPLVTRRKGKNSHSALIAASSLTLVSVCLASLGVWRLTEDVDLTGSFIFPDGILSHWQVWLASAVLTQYGAWRLTQYAKLARVRGTETEEVSEAPSRSGVVAKV